MTQQSAISASWVSQSGPHSERRSSAFGIGLDARGEISLDDHRIDRALAAVFLRDGKWCVRNLGGDQVLFNGRAFQDVPVPLRGVIQFGESGLHVILEFEGSQSTTRTPPRAPGNVGYAAAPAAAPAPAPRPPGPAAGNAGRTVLAGRGGQASAPSPNVPPTASPLLVVGPPELGTLECPDNVRIGRGEGSAIRLQDDKVSRHHAELFRLGKHWCVRDLGSSNGTFLDGQRVGEAPLPGRCTLQLGEGGPVLELSYDAPAGTSAGGSLKSIDEVAARYFDPKSQAPAGQHTMMVRKAFTAAQQKQKRKYGSVIAGALVLLVVAVGIGIYQYVQLQRTRAIAEQLFYNMKTVELQLARLEAQMAETGTAEQRAQAAKGRAQLADMATQYDALLSEMGFITDKTPPEDRIIIEMARKFGEFELGMPKDFIAEVKRYIALWRADQRMAKALGRAHEQELAPIISGALERHHLPPQFFYLAMQESDFRTDAVGPETRFGIAKGMWQFMPATANHYGLQVGPLIAQAEFDPDDQRFDPVAASDAAAQYLADLYRDEAQASGLLVLASYNWGTTRVRDRILAMKENPRDRNFWALLRQTDVPKETRDYVFRIFSAAVIGEDPRLFGFEFERPLTNGHAIEPSGAK